MSDDGRKFLDDSVTEEETTEEEIEEEVALDDVEVETTKLDPVLVDLEEFKRRGKAATTVDERLKFAEAVPITTYGCEVMVAPSQGFDAFRKMFMDPAKMFGEGDSEPDLSQIDEAFLEQFVISCTVSPQLDEEALRDLARTASAEYAMLQAACMRVTMKQPLERMSERLGMINTEAQQRFFDDVVGSMS